MQVSSLPRCKEYLHSVRAYLSEKEAKQARMRYKVVEEIIETERTYVKGLVVVIDVRFLF